MCFSDAPSLSFLAFIYENGFNVRNGPYVVTVLFIASIAYGLKEPGQPAPHPDAYDPRTHEGQRGS
jgi:hypothetical protein